MITDVGDADIRRRHKVGGARMAYALSNKYNRIQRNGEIVAWRFYSNYGGEVALQVWRHIGNTTQLVQLYEITVMMPTNKKLIYAEWILTCLWTGPFPIEWVSS